MLRETPNNESIIVEYGFADSTGDDPDQIKNNWKDLTEAVVRALASYIGVPYTPPKGQESGFYTVKKGDTLYTIARNYGVTVNEIKDANNLSSNNLTIGMTLMIPDSQDMDTDTENYYIVQAGDTLYKIASKYNMTVNELKALNNLTSNNLSIGQRLKVLESEISGNTYVVKPGDSLYSIAKRFNISVDELKRVNNKASNLLTIGEVLEIPSTTSNEVYIVKAGDTLYNIARMYNTSVDAIKRLNNMSNNNLSIGMRLMIP